ncbi:major facilitator superfamily domain-containing protein [Rhexocercosporidium sp. MPI-PUGE-AT-0058]|nr:major facilitator superfamily domain-containing protein [Rhexocercosporidium sp. MPI-PUGE-AT-0058]
MGRHGGFITARTGRAEECSQAPGSAKAVNMSLEKTQEEVPSSIQPSKDSSSDVEQIPADEPAVPEFQRPISTVQWTLVCVGLFLGAILYGLDTTIAADVQGPILVSLGEIDKLAWVGIGFPMGSVAIILLIGWCYALFEIKWLMIGSIVVFEIGSAICGAAPTMNAMIVGRVIAGMGGAGMYMGALTYVAVFTSFKEKPIYNALIGISWGTGCILGPVVGGAFSVSSATWRWAFYINLPLAALLSPVYIFLFPKHNGMPQISGPKKLASIDWVGTTLNAAVFTLFQVAATFSGSTWAWNNAGPIALWVIFAVTLVLLVLQQIFSIATTPKQRLFPVHLLKSRTILLLYFGTAASATGLTLGVYYVPLFFQFTRGDSAIQAAIRLLPFICILITFIMISGGVLPALGRYMPFYAVAGVFLIIGGSLMFTVDSTTSKSSIYGYEVLMAIGAGLTMQVAYSVAPAAVEEEDIQGAIGLINVAQIGTTAIALSIASCLFQNIGFIKLRDALVDYDFTAAELRSALGGAQSAILAGGDAVTRNLAINSIVETISKVWILVIVAGGVSLISSVFMKREKLALQ